MPGPNLNQSLLAGSADYKASNWLEVSASGKLELLAAAELRRGLNLGLGIEALVELDASLRKFIALDVNAQANAAARVQAQVQVPLDLFSEAGFAVRLQAVAEAAVGINLGIGLSVGEFLALAGADPRMKGAPLKLLALLLEPDQVVVSAGVRAKAAASAMAYVNFLITGSLVGNKPGFLAATEAGLGLKAGAGYQVSVNFGLNSPHRFVRRSIDIAVDETTRLIAEELDDPAQRAMVSELRTPAKIAFRAAFELGAALAENGGAFRAGDGPQLAQRLCIVILEEGQRLVLETMTTFALDSFQALLRGVGISQAEWDAAQAHRSQLADRLRQMPEDPFDLLPSNRDYWASVISDMAELGAQLLGAASQTGDTPAAILWSALQLLFRGTERISNAQIRGQIIGVGAHTRTAAFDQALHQQPPRNIRRTINAALSRQPDDRLSEGQLVDFLVRDAVLQPLVQAAPSLEQVLGVVFGPSAGAGAAAARVILRESGSFVPGPNGAVNSEATLRALLDGLQTYIDNRMRNELLPAIRPALGNRPEIALYLDELLLPTVDHSIHLLAERVLTWRQNQADDQMALREACSGVLMKLVSRSLVVSLDVLQHTCLSGIQHEFRQAAANVNNDNDSIAARLAAATGLDRAFLAELMEETLLLGAETFVPLSADRRQRIRSLLFRLTDVLPGRARDDFLDQLKDDFFVPNLEAGVELAQLSGEMIAEYVQRFVTALLNRVGTLILEELQEFFEDAQAAVSQWLRQLDRFVTELLERLRELERQVEELSAEVMEAWDEAFDALESLMLSIGNSGRSSVRAKVKAALLTRAIDILEDNDIYKNLPREAKDFAKNRLDIVVGSVLNSELFNDVWGVVASLSGEAAELMEDIRDLDLDSNLTTQISALLLDRVEDVIYDFFGGGDTRIPLAISVRLDLGFTKIEESINLGSVRLPIDSLISSVRSGIGGLAFVEGAIRVIADRVTDALEATGRLVTAQDSKEATEEEHRRVRTEIDNSGRSGFEIEALSPTPAGFYDTSTVEVEIFLKNVPLSYLGLGDLEQQRVNIILNREDLDLSTFVVEEIQGPAAVDLPPLQLGGRIGIGGVDATQNRPAGVAAPAAGAPTLRYQPGVPVGPWGETVILEPAAGDPRIRFALFRAQQGKRVAPRTESPQRAVFQARSQKAVPVLGASKGPSLEKGSSSRVGRGVGIVTRDPLGGRRGRHAGRGGAFPALGGRGIPADTSGLPTLGRTLTVRQRLGRIESLGTGLLLRALLPASRFVEGPNAITIAIIPGRGRRIERAVTFVVFPGAPARPPRVPLITDKTRELPALDALRGFTVRPAAAPPDAADRKPIRVKGGGRPPKEKRQEDVQRSLNRQKARSRQTSDALDERAALVRSRARAHGVDGKHDESPGRKSSDRRLEK